MTPEDLRSYTATGLLRDGTSVRIRAIRPDDRALLAEHFAGLSAETVYYRFFRAKKRLTDEELTTLTELDFDRRAALLVTAQLPDGERLIGVGRYVAGDGGDGDHAVPRHRAEVAFTVGDAWQGRGVGSLLLDHLVRVARANGITEFEADVLGSNNKMLHVFARSGFTITRSLDSGVFHVQFPVLETDAHRDAELTRTRVAAAASMQAVLRPRSVAVVGASREPGSLGALVLQQLLAADFAGPVHPVNPAATALHGRPCFPTVTAIGEPVDLVVIAVPAPQVEAVVADCARAGVRAVVIVSSGFAEASEAGRAAQDRIVALARGAGMRVVGPNCMGVIETHPDVRLHASFTPVHPPAGGVGMLWQAGALGSAVLEHATRLGLGISAFLSVGNKADVSSNDLLAWWNDDERTRVVCLYLESFGNPRRFARLAPEVARRKPIVAVKSGRAAAPTRKAESHAAALATLDVAVDALFETAGVIRTETIEQLVDVAALLATQPAPGGPRVGIVTNSGAPGLLAADACRARGLEVPALAPATLAALPADAVRANPVNLHWNAQPAHYAAAVAAVGADPGVDAVLALYVPPVTTDGDAIGAAIADGASRVPAHVPVLTVFLSARGTPEALRTAPRGAIPAYGFPENAVAALAAAERWSRWRRRPRGDVLVLADFAKDAIRAVVDRALTGAAAPRWLSEADVVTVLRAAGIGVVPGVTTSVGGAWDAAPLVGFPLVAKAWAPGVLHKADLGVVELNVTDMDALHVALERMADRMQAAGRDLPGVTLQRQVAGGLEAIVGVTTDPTFGPIVLCGLGGTFVELLHDVSFRIPPVSDHDADEMLDRLRAAPLLAGYRGAPPADRAALVDVVRRVSALVELVPEIRELDLNPVKVLAPGDGAVVVDARIRVAPPAP